MSKAFRKLREIYTKSKLDIDDESNTEALHSAIDKASREVSDVMISGLKQLAALVDIEYLDVLPYMFGDGNELNEKVELIVVEAIKIYDEGEKIFESFRNIIETNLS